MKKVIVLGLDGGTFEILDPWIKEGKLPNFRKLKRKGSYGILRTLLPPITATAWPSFFTGTNPGKHGLFSFTNITKDYKLRICSGNGIKSEPVWNIIGEKGLKTALINLPMTYPPSKINGEVICGLMTPSEFSNFTYPKDLKKELDEILSKKYLVHPLPYRGDNEEKFLKSLNETLEMRFKLLDHYMKKNFDLIISVIGGTDKISHALLKYIDKKHPLYTEKESKKWRGKILNYFQKIDYNLGKLMKNLGEYSLLIMSDHGSERSMKRFSVSEWLKENNLLYLKEDKKKSFSLDDKKATKIAKFLDNHNLGFVRRIIKTFLPWRSMFSKGKKIDINMIDWKRTKAFVIPGNRGIFINSKERFVNGIVSKNEANKLKDIIVEKLSKLRDDEGNKMDIIVKKTEDIYSGKYLKEAPEIVYFISKTISASKEAKLWSPVGEISSSGHSMEGIFFALGNSISKNNKLNNASILDISPTILKLMGFKKPKHMDGEPLDIFK